VFALSESADFASADHNAVAVAQLQHIAVLAGAVLYMHPVDEVAAVHPCKQVLGQLPLKPLQRFGNQQGSAAGKIDPAVVAAGFYADDVLMRHRVLRV
jgi:hypothetical protein